MARCYEWTFLGADDGEQRSGFGVYPILHNIHYAKRAVLLSLRLSLAVCRDRLKNVLNPLIMSTAFMMSSPTALSSSLAKWRLDQQFKEKSSFTYGTPHLIVDFRPSLRS